ncbi:site-specific integrase [soil metagenome]
MKATLHYVLRTERPRPDGSAIIYLRLTINRRNKPVYSLYRSIPLKKQYKHFTLEQIETYPIKKITEKTITRDELYCWDKDKERATRGFGSMDTLNQFLNEEIVRAEDIVNDLAKRRRPLTKETFKKAFKKTNVDMPLYEYCHEQLIVNKDSTLSKETIKSYMSIISKIEAYKPGIRMEDIDFKFLNTYANYLRKSKLEGGKANGERTLNNNMKVIRTMILLAIKNDDFMVEHYPFKDYKVGSMDTELTSRDFLEPEELLELEKIMFLYYPPSKPIAQVGKAEWAERKENGILNPGEYQALKYFLFACYSGLRYKDMLLLNMQEHIKGKWVKNALTQQSKFRYYIDVEEMHKTGKMLIVPLIDKAFALLDMEKEGLAFKVLSNQKTNQHLKFIATLAKINKNLSFHVARHSFATTCFTYGIPAEVGQKLLGHKSEKFIKIYTHLTQNTLFIEMDKVNRGFNEFEQLLRVVHRQENGEETNQAAEIVRKMENKQFRELVERLSKFDDDKLAAITKTVA